MLVESESESEGPSIDVHGVLAGLAIQMAPLRLAIVELAAVVVVWTDLALALLCRGYRGSGDGTGTGTSSSGGVGVGASVGVGVGVGVEVGVGVGVGTGVGLGFAPAEVTVRASSVTFVFCAAADFWPVTVTVNVWDPGARPDSSQRIVLNTFVDA